MVSSYGGHDRPWGFLVSTSPPSILGQLGVTYFAPSLQGFAWEITNYKIRGSDVKNSSLKLSKASLFQIPRPRFMNFVYVFIY